MNQPTDRDVIVQMSKLGGSFVQALARTATRADPENLRRLKAAWPELWIKYTALAAAELSKNKPTTELNPCQTSMS